MNIQSLASFVIRKVPVYGEHLKYKDKLEDIKHRINTLKIIKSQLKEELNCGGVHKKEKFYPLSTERRDALTKKIKSIDQRIKKLKRKIQKESVESSMSMVGQVAGTISNTIAPGSGILVSGATAAIKAGHHNYQSLDLNELPRSISQETGKAVAYSTLGRIAGIAKNCLLM